MFMYEYITIPTLLRRFVSIKFTILWLVRIKPTPD